MSMTVRIMTGLEAGAILYLAVTPPTLLRLTVYGVLLTGVLWSGLRLASLLDQP